jgi:hypothetical protein
VAADGPGVVGTADGAAAQPDITAKTEKYTTWRMRPM